MTEQEQPQKTKADASDSREKDQPQAPSGEAPSPDEQASSVEAEKPNSQTAERSWETNLEVYPLRDPSEDPRWAVRTVWTWVGCAVFSLVFIVVLLVLGLIYD